MRLCIQLTLIVLIALMAKPKSSLAQTVDDTGLWLALFAQDDFRKSEESRWKWWFDGQLRFVDDIDGLNQSIVRPGVGRKLHKNLVGWTGYAWIHTTSISMAEFEEHRIWQQLTWSTSNELWTLALRPRFEQRLVETGDDVGLRFRQFARVQRKLPSFPRLSLVCWDEVFFNMNDTDWGAESGFDQNRVFVGVGIKRHARSRLRTEIGYLNQSIDLPTNPNRSNHILAINLFY